MLPPSVGISNTQFSTSNCGCNGLQAPDIDKANRVSWLAACQRAAPANLI
jgi:hypothetical protein